ncbi:MAG: hypothetical protein A3G31_09555 [Candidatus Schekmanbacteria bacterium RIFCSPLOWO2_12_FULL_38_15]|uniref:DUF2283 domain-containing protein n=1 Tax=Candidatus Schekmanbacteria bacterium RIFCSPLOWO2_12_FULL_38_15 TaxID=1817883 RepID=A0A1F7SPU2_9BACT|nr:MAG: hypothetical protein A3G31_09555 [Candidatus Schekmanbacteria bacterium RIFCSPLOWO2_12_FULL_38_15]
MEKIKLPQGKSVNSYYDEEADVLYVSFGEPVPSESLDTGEDLLIRFNPKTGEITGFTVLNFSEFGREIEEVVATSTMR